MNSMYIYSTVQKEVVRSTHGPNLANNFGGGRGTMSTMGIRNAGAFILRLVKRSPPPFFLSLHHPCNRLKICLFLFARLQVSSPKNCSQVEIYWGGGHISRPYPLPASSPVKLCNNGIPVVESSWNVMAHGGVREGKWRGNWRMEWIANTLHAASEVGVSSITIADAHTSAASSRLNWRPRRFKWTCPFRRKTKSGFCGCAITFQT